MATKKRKAVKRKPREWSGEMVMHCSGIPVWLIRDARDRASWKSILKSRGEGERIIRVRIVEVVK